VQQEKEQIAKEREDSRRTIAYLQQLLHKKLGGDIDSLLVGNLKVPVGEPTLSTSAPSLEGVPSVAFPVAGGASGSQFSPLVAEESLFLRQCQRISVILESRITPRSLFYSLSPQCRLICPIFRRHRLLIRHLP
jgi:hypothetical protein